MIFMAAGTTPFDRVGHDDLRYLYSSRTLALLGGGLAHDGGNYSGKAEASQGAITEEQVDSRPKSHDRRNSLNVPLSP